MALPQPEFNKAIRLAAKYAKPGMIIPLTSDFQVLIRVASADPSAIDTAISVLVLKFNEGLIHPGHEATVIRWFNGFAKVSEYSRSKIASGLSKDLLDFYCGASLDPGLRQAAEQLSDTLKVERPKHYYDLCRNILNNNGSIFIIGAGFSYDSYTPLLRETEGIACSTLFDLGVTDPRQLYHTDERKAWEMIWKGWQIFQNHIAYMLLPKEPSDQHFILGELFHAGHITHIISFNWDDLVEKAYSKLYNEDIPVVTGESITSTHALWKLHGDIAHPEARWVLPFEKGRVFNALGRIILETTLPTISLGYREQEAVVRQKLIAVLENRGGITRIRPDLTNSPPESFGDNALMAMKKIKAGFESAKRSVQSA